MPASLDFLLQDVTSVAPSVLEVEQPLPQDLDNPAIILAAPAHLPVQPTGPAHLPVQLAVPPEQTPSPALAAPLGGTGWFGLTYGRRPPAPVPADRRFSGKVFQRRSSEAQPFPSTVASSRQLLRLLLV
jgi:hypothetical protein